jgi:predicted DNA-binding transcriptional regulator AlpA
MCLTKGEVETEKQDAMRKYITTEQLLKNVPYTEVHIMRLVKAGKFPPPIKPGGHKKLWDDEKATASLEEMQRAAEAEIQAGLEKADHAEA